MKKVLVTEEELNIAAKSYTKMVGNGVQHRVIDLHRYAKYLQEERLKSNKTMVIEIQPMKENSRHEERYVFSQVRDTTRDVLYGDLVKVHPDDQLEWKKNVINTSLTLNLNNIQDCKIWALMRLWPKVEGSPFTKGYEPHVYKVFDPDDDAEARNEYINAKKLAFDRLGKLVGEELVAMMNLCEIQTDDSMSVNRVRALIGDYADRFPVDFNNKYEDERRDRLSLFKAGVRLSIIKYDSQVGYTFRGKVMGSAESGCLKWLSENPEPHRELVEDVRGADKIAYKILHDEYPREYPTLHHMTIKKLKEDGDLPENWTNGDPFPKEFDYSKIPSK